MSEKPKHRWFQFRLSTWLVMAGILSWLMASLPFYDPEFDKTALADSRTINPSLRWPMLAFVAFIGWKLAWRSVERRREQLANDSTTYPDGMDEKPIAKPPELSKLQDRLLLVLTALLAWSFLAWLLMPTVH